MLALTLLFLQGCGGELQPFSKRNAPGGKTPPAITVTAMSGMPVAKANLLFNNLATAAGKRDIAIVRGAFNGGYTMVGEFEARPTDTSTDIVFRWTVYNAERKVIHTIASKEDARLGGADPWAGVDPDLLRRIAGFTAESLATRLHALGYATRLSGLPPPGTLARAGPNAGQQIDYETLYGPGAVAPPMAALQPVPGATPAPVSPTPLVTPPPQRIVNVPPRKAPVRTASVKKKPAKAKIKISAVAMTTVSGSPGKGNQELLTAMRQVMRSIGWPVFSRPRADALTVSGRVKLYPPNGKQQKVAVAWTVKMPDGEVLGVIRQANNVPAGSLDKGWGKAATYVSQGAAQGIFKLVKKVQ